MLPEARIRRSIVVAICLFASSAIGLSTLAQQAGNRTAADSPAPLQLEQSSRESYAQGDPGKAREQLAGLLDVYRAEHASNPSWRGRYQWSRRLAEVAHEYLRDGELDDALAVLGEAADLDVPLRKGFDNGLASAAGGLHRRLAGMNSDRRYELLHEWSMPTESHPSVRVLVSLVGVVAPPPVFARALGERPRASSFAIAHVGEVTGLFSTAWELVQAADDAGRLRRLIAELEKLAQRKVPNAKHVLSLAKVRETKRRDDDMLRELNEQLAELRDNSPRPVVQAGSDSFDDSWQYGYCRFDDAQERNVEFTPLTHWTGAAWQLTPDRPHGELGFMRIDRTGGHPAPTRPCVRRWVAPTDGVVFLTGTMHHPAKKGNGVRGRIVSSRTGVHGEWTALDGSLDTKTGSITVKAGDTIDLLVDAMDDNYYDTFVWMVQLRFDANHGRQLYDSVADFCGPSDKHVLSDTVLAAACLERDWLRPVAESILQKLVENTFDTDKWNNRPFEFRCRLIRPMLRRAWAVAVRKRSGETSPELLEDPGLALWMRGGDQASGQQLQGQPRDLWLAHEDHILHLSGSLQDRLFFKYPLTGKFQISFETQTGGRPGTDGAVSYGGLAYEVSVADELFVATADDWRIGSPFSELTSRSRRFHGQYVGQPEFHRFTLSSAPGRATFLAGGQPVWSDPSTDSSSPWIALQATGDRTPIFRNLKITGDPTIPREVRLSDGDQLRGWEVGRDDKDVLPTAQDRASRVIAQRDERQRISNANFRIPYFFRDDDLIASYLPPGPAEGLGPPPKTRDWFATEGVIHSPRRGRDDQTADQRRLRYSRPLQSGESISYEFYYGAGEIEVHPALGRLAFLIEPAGVRLHWITDGDREWTGLAEDNAVVEPFDRRGPKPLPLAAKDWNRMTIELADGQVRLSLNGQAIYEHKLQAQDDCTFGLYHDANRSTAQVRNVVLRGDWPERLTDEQRDNLAAISGADRSAADRLALSRLFAEQHVAHNVLAVRRRAAKLPLDERYQYLADWVLPSRDHDALRLYGMFGPTNPAPPVAEYTSAERARLEEAGQRGLSRIQTGGALFAPALDLIDAAKQLGRLDDLRDRVEALTTAEREHSQTRPQLALLILIDIAREDFVAADRRLKEFCEQAVEPTSLADERWPELLVFSAALLHREVHQLPGESLLAIVEKDIRTGGTTGSDELDRQLPALIGLKRHFDDGNPSIDSYFDEVPLKQWVPVSRVSAKSRGPGMPVARWRSVEKSVFNYAGHDDDYLYFQSPLRGNYEIDCEVTSFGWRESHLLVGGKYVAPVFGMSHFDLGDLRGEQGRFGIDPPLWNHDEGYVHYRVTVQDSIATTFFNGRPVHAESLAAGYEPWVAIRSEYNRHGGVRDLRISGHPVIPAELRLLHDDQLTGWVPYYGATIGRDWQFADGALVGGKHDEAAEEDRESLLYYHRPMLEDGSIEYEFFYEPGQSHVHPALDRLAFLLDADGLNIHWCTDGADDRTQLPPSNRSVEPDNRRGPDRLPLKAVAWNRLRLALSGNTVELQLNGEPVYRRDLEASNMRQFGLFHYSDRTATRVRNVVWKGDWPRKLPSLAEQELANVSLVAKLDAKLPDMQALEHDFAKGGLEPKLFRILPGGDATIAARRDGVHVTQPGTDPNVWHENRISLRLALTGDFDVTASFDQLVTTRPAAGRYAGVAVVACLQCEPYINLWLHRRRAGYGEQFIETTSQHPTPDGEARWDVWKNLPNESTRGTLRLARRGKTIYYLYADGDSTQYRLHREQELSDAPVKMDGLMLFTQMGGIGSTSVVCKSVSVRADKITYDPTRNVAPKVPEEKTLLKSILDLFK